MQAESSLCAEAYAGTRRIYPEPRTVSSSSVSKPLSILARNRLICVSHNVGLGIEVEFPDIFKQHCARENAAGIAHHIFKQPELARLKGNVLAGAFHLSANQVHFEVRPPG